MKSWEWAQKALKSLDKYKYVLLVALVGAVLLIWPSGEKQNAAPSAARAGDDLFASNAMEEKLEKALSQIEGAGEVSVVLTLNTGPRKVLAQDGSAAEESDRTTQESQIVLTSRGSGTQEPVTLQEVAPTYRGALVVAQGGDAAEVGM